LLVSTSFAAAVACYVDAVTSFTAKYANFGGASSVFFALLKILRMLLTLHYQELDGLC